MEQPREPWFPSADVEIMTYMGRGSIRRIVFRRQGHGRLQLRDGRQISATEFAAELRKWLARMPTICEA